MYVAHGAPIAQWLDQWTGKPEVTGSNPTGCYISASGEEGIGKTPHKWLRPRQKMATVDAVSKICHKAAHKFKFFDLAHTCVRVTSGMLCFSVWHCCVDILSQFILQPEVNLS